MKDSGIDWIWEIPKHYEIWNIWLFFDAKAWWDVKPELYSDIKDNGHPYPVYTNTSNPDVVYAYTSQPVFNENTITVTWRGDIWKAFYRNHKYDAIIRLISLAPRNNIDCRYYAYFIWIIHFFTDSSAVWQLSAQQISAYHVISLPLGEQKQIADYLDKECWKIDKVIAYREQMIEKIEEYKKSLIYECVTWKKEIL